MNVYLDNSATTPLTDSIKDYLLSILDDFGNPSSLHSVGTGPKQIISEARQSAAEFIHANDKEIYFVPSGSAGNTLAVKGLVSDNPQENQYEVFYSPTAHKSMLKACESCRYHTPLKVTTEGKIDVLYLQHVLENYNSRKPLVCIEAANSEIGTINDVIAIGFLVHEYNGLLVVDATGYIPSYQVDMRFWKEYVDILTFSGHKLHALKGVGILWKKNGIDLKPLVYGSQENGYVGGTENVLGIASLGKAVEDYDYSSISSANRNYIYDYILNNIPESYLVGAAVHSGNRLPHNLYMCFKGVEGESLMFLLDMKGIQVSTGSACNSHSLSASTTLSAIGMDENDIHSCIRMTCSGKETIEELDYVCQTLKQCVETLRELNTE
ncbi:MAG: cysteine desulfurase family protein [Lachnospiraceae bacterium]|jgi:cysteine desulfurase